MEIIKYEGKSNYIIILYKQDDELYVLYALTNPLVINGEVKTMNILDGHERIITNFSFKKDFTINIPLLQRENKIFSIIKVDNEEAYDLIKTVVEDLL